MTTRSSLVCALALVALAPAMASGDEADERRIEELESRVDELETAQSQRGGRLSDWFDRVRLGGSANVGYYDGQSNSVMHDAGPQVRDVRFFVDAELGEDVRLFDKTIFRNVGFSFEWDLVRIGILRNTVGDLYVDLQGIGGTGWLNLQVGRFQIPIGENYLRFGKGYHTNPFISNSVGGPWWWDEGFKLYGGDSGGLFSYVASISQGETAFNSSVSSQKQYTLKLILDPTRWLHMSASGLYGGAIGAEGNPGSGGALWLGESWARAIGSGTFVPTWVNGAIVPPGPARTKSTWFVGADVIIDFPRWTRLWLSYGYYDIDRNDPVYDGHQHTWIVELLLYGSLIADALEDVYLGARANGLGSYDGGRGNLLDFRTASTLGYNTESLTDYSVVLGWKANRYLTFRVEYTHRVADLVDGADFVLQPLVDGRDFWGVEVGVYF